MKLLELIRGNTTVKYNIYEVIITYQLSHRSNISITFYDSNKNSTLHQFNNVLVTLQYAGGFLLFAIVMTSHSCHTYKWTNDATKRWELHHRPFSYSADSHLVCSRASGGHGRLLLTQYVYQFSNSPFLLLILLNAEIQWLY